MQTELEAKFLDIDPHNLRQRLKKLGARLVSPERLMRRYNYDYPDRRLGEENHAWVRLRDENGKVTISYKQYNDSSLHGTKELTLVVNDFEAAHQFFLALGLEVKSYQETKRESWMIDDTEIEIDTWPWIPSFVELEGKDPDTLKDIAARLGLDWATALHGPVNFAYAKYYDADPRSFSEIKEISLSAPIPDWLAASRRPNRSPKL